jgi:[NiFe] hydrogenase assembly HybE family chaperone
LTLKIHTDDPAPLLEAAFRRIEAERMAGVPILNPALRVEAVGFARWQGHWLGALITPWFMNLVLVPGPEGEWQSVADGARIFRHFPAGDYAFLGGNEAELGEFQTCALFSPMGLFADQDGVRAVAVAALGMLMVDPSQKEAEAPALKENLDRLEQVPERRPMSKRQFLGSVFPRG